ncbi:hypothetical protein J3R82DRAFT_6698 [Butyriboletus roseoflavus]|nr:hypothetical protein J3R82DRAFT_6698 [Butyriboletus roseoflavus]
MLSQEDFTSLFSRLTKQEIITAIHDMPFQRGITCTHQTLFKAICNDKFVHDRISGVIGEKKQRIEEEHQTAMKYAHLDQQDVAVEVEENFLDDVGEDVQRSCVEQFIDYTSNDAVCSVPCVVCGGEFFFHETNHLDVSTLPYKHILYPYMRNPHQHLVNEMILYNEGLMSEDNHMFGHICTSCQTYLNMKRTPSWLLANGLWVGEVPEVLSILTLPNRILVAHYYPVAYIVKLYPKRKGASYSDVSMLNSGLRGNVLTYRMNTQDIVSMVHRNLLSPSSIILSVTIAVTFMGPGNLPDHHLPSMLSVSRNHIRNALCFLQEENPLMEILESQRKIWNYFCKMEYQMK